MLWTDLGGDGQWLERGLAQYELERPEIRGSSCRRPGGGTDSLAAGEVERNGGSGRFMRGRIGRGRDRNGLACLLDAELQLSSGSHCRNGNTL
jgi:hypothetical protein